MIVPNEKTALGAFCVLASFSLFAVIGYQSIKLLGWVMSLLDAPTVQDLIEHDRRP